MKKWVAEWEFYFVAQGKRRRGFARVSGPTRGPEGDWSVWVSCDVEFRDLRIFGATRAQAVKLGKEFLVKVYSDKDLQDADGGPFRWTP